ncbi:hypothetical protein BGX28_003097 [Mortierella sp. GBA30]|nr:hypothetical protein BGX28_003097 [Mortierella sp. GBA30]
MGIIPSTSQPVICGGSVGANYTANCYSLSASQANPTVFTTIPGLSQNASPQDGCALIPYSTGFTVIPGYLAGYHTTQPAGNAPSPPMATYDMRTNAWSLIPNGQSIVLPITTYPLAAVMPGTNAAIVYGGSSPYMQHYTEMLVLNLQSFSWSRSLDPAPNQYVAPPTSVTSASTAPSASPTGTANTRSLDVAAIAGGVTGSLALIALTAGIIYTRRRAPYKPASASAAPQGRSEGENPEDEDYAYETPDESKAFVMPRLKTVQAYEFDIADPFKTPARNPHAIASGTL